MASLGKETELAAKNFIEHFSQVDLFKDRNSHDDTFKKIANEFQVTGWADNESAKVLNVFLDLYLNKKSIEVSSFLKVDPCSQK